MSSGGVFNLTEVSINITDDERLLTEWTFFKINK